MKRIATNQLIPGMITAEDVYNFSRQLILPKGTVLTDEIITRLDFYSIISVYIVDDETMPTADDFQNFSKPYSERLKSSPQFKEFKSKYDFQIENFRSTLNDVIEKNTKLDSDTLLLQVLGLLSSHYGRVNLFDMLHNMREYNDATYAHSVNVGLICNMFAQWLHLSEEDVRIATLCGLLHDVGKLMIPLEILNKPAKLTTPEFDVIKKHPVNGYRSLIQLRVDQRICNAALLHHEKCDGSGYPYGFTGHKLDIFTKMVTISDIYDAMTCARIYRGPLCPFKVVELFENEGFQKYDTKLILTFLSHIVDTYLSNSVHLSNGQEGEVVFINKNKLSCPTVKCGDEFINLTEHPHIHIEYII